MNLDEDNVLTETDPPEQPIVQTTTEIQEEKPEEDVTKLDLRQPEHLEKFKSSYQVRVSEVAERDQRIEALELDNDTLRASQGKGVYLDTNVPLDDFKASIKENLDRMRQEEPEYHAIAMQELLEPHFWSNVGEKFESIQERVLDDKVEQDGLILQQMESAWNVMCRRVVGVEGNVVYGILEKIADSPDIKEELMRRLQGQSRYNPEQPFQFSQTQPPPGTSFQQPAQIETVAQIAQRLHLDPSEEVHMRHIEFIQNEQRVKQTEQYTKQATDTRLQQQYDTRINQMQQTIDSLKNDKERTSLVSDEDLTKQAELRLSALTGTALDDLIQKEYSNSVTKERSGLLGKLKTLAQTRLDSDPIYQQAERTATKWFKQAASAKNPSDRDRWDKKGIDALAAMVPIRLRAVNAEAQELLGTNRERPRRVETRRPVELPSQGTAAPPRSEASPAPAGDINAAKQNILKRARDRNLFQPR